MKKINIYLIVVSLLLIFALATVVYVWSVIQDTQKTIEVETGAQMNTGMDSQTQEESDEVDKTTPVYSETEPQIDPVTIDMADIPESQQKILETFGFEGETFTVTPAMISCSEDAVGKTRFNEIVSGAAPSPLESLKLLPCFKK